MVADWSASAARWSASMWPSRRRAVAGGTLVGVRTGVLVRVGAGPVGVGGTLVDVGGTLVGVGGTLVGVGVARWLASQWRARTVASIAWEGQGIDFGKIGVAIAIRVQILDGCITVVVGRIGIAIGVDVRCGGRRRARMAQSTAIQLRADCSRIRCSERAQVAAAGLGHVRVGERENPRRQRHQSGHQQHTAGAQTHTLHDGSPLWDDAGSCSISVRP